MPVDWWFDSKGGGVSSDSGVGEIWRQETISWVLRTLCRCGLSAGTCAHADQWAKVSSVVDELARDWASGEQWGGVYVLSTVSSHWIIISWLIGSCESEVLAVKNCSSRSMVLNHFRRLKDRPGQQT